MPRAPSSKCTGKLEAPPALLANQSACFWSRYCMQMRFMHAQVQNLSENCRYFRSKVCGRPFCFRDWGPQSREKKMNEIDVTLWLDGLSVSVRLEGSKWWRRALIGWLEGQGHKFAYKPRLHPVRTQLFKRDALRAPNSRVFQGRKQPTCAEYCRRHTHTKKTWRGQKASRAYRSWIIVLVVF